MGDKRKGLLYVFDELVTNATRFKPAKLQKERGEAYEQIRNLVIQQKSQIDENYVERKAEELHEAYWPSLKSCEGKYQAMRLFGSTIRQIISDIQGKEVEVDEKMKELFDIVKETNVVLKDLETLYDESHDVASSKGDK